MDNLITDALNYSKVVREEFVLKPVDAGGLLKGILESYPQFHPPRAQVSIENHIPVRNGERGGSDAMLLQPVRQRSEVCNAGHSSDD